MIGLKHGEKDARVWAAEFKRYNPDADEDTMVGWFANAIMSGWDAAHWERVDPVREVLLDAIPDCGGDTTLDLAEEVVEALAIETRIVDTYRQMLHETGMSLDLLDQIEDGCRHG